MTVERNMSLIKSMHEAHDHGEREDYQERYGEQEVCIAVAGDNEIVSSITNHSAEKMNLRQGSKVCEIVKVP